MLRISLIIAVIAGLGIAVLNVVVVKDKIDTLVKDRNTQKSDKEIAQNDLRTTTAKLKTTETDLATTKETLKTTTEAKDKAEAEVADLTKKNTDLADNLKKTQQEREEARNELAAWKALGKPVEAVNKIIANFDDMQRRRDAALAESKVLMGKVRNLTAKINELIDPETDGPLMAAGLKGKVVAADPKYDFVVLDIGQKQGVVQYGRFLVNRNGKLVAKLKVQSVEPDRCIANVMPGWKLGEVVEGDQVIY